VSGAVNHTLQQGAVLVRSCGSIELAQIFGKAFSLQPSSAKSNLKIRKKSLAQMNNKNEGGITMLISVPNLKT
jgi:hypothetical protein